ncbi:MAG: hypothetical protein L3J73_04715, partial [Thermoplasmata archaeon]|nr:hypothetical protein [Thermoplasmata archaeon]
TDSEAATVLSILSKDGGGENSDLGSHGIPTSTYYATRRKIYDAGWLTDKYVPDPRAAGVQSIDCVLAQPDPTERARLERAWASSAETVLLWSGLNSVLAILFRRSGGAPKVADGTTVSVSRATGSVPVYFDYSRAWSRFVRVERQTSYPRSLPIRDPAEPETSPALAEMTLPDGGEEGRPAGGHRWHSAARLSPSQRRLVERGAVRSRTFVNLDALPPYDGRALGEIALVTGELRKGFSAADVLASLNNECAVSPFFLADDGTRILLLALGQIRADSSKRTKVPRATAPAAATLGAAQTDIRMAVERTDTVRKIVDHRYELLFPPTVAP